MSTLHITDCSSCCDTERMEKYNQIRENLIRYNLSKQPLATNQPILLTLTAPGTPHVLGGLTGRLAWNWLHVELLWVDKSIRSQNYGTQLIEKAESIAIQAGCIGSHLETASFQAPSFYEKLGYEIFARLDNKPQGQVLYYLKKELIKEQT